MSETTLVATYVDTETHVLSAVNGVDYAYRSIGASGGTPLVMLQHFAATSTIGIPRSSMRSPAAAG